MDPLSAISLAGNILAFLDFAAKITTAAKEVHTSASGSTEADQNLGNILRQMKDFSIGVEKRSISAKVTPETDKIRHLAYECEDIIEDLLELLDDFKSKNPGSKRESVKVAWRRITKQKKTDLEERLAHCRSTLIVGLTHLNQTETQRKLEEIIKSHKSERGELSAIRRHLQATRTGVETCSLGGEAVYQLRQILNFSDQVIFKVRTTLILDALRFETMNERFDSVEEAHSTRFDWIYASYTPNTSRKDLRNNLPSSLPDGSPKGNYTDTRQQHAKKFQDWLTSNDGIFHVAGKLGSGKSTLMKFLFSHHRTCEMLLPWVGTKTLVLARFFFWKPGTSLQKSLNGLFGSLTFRVLSQCPELIPGTFPQQWEETEYFTSGTHQLAFDYSEVRKAFQGLLSKADVYEKRKFVFFIDGLDEFEPESARIIHEHAVSLFKTWSSQSHGNVKICLSSREWPEYFFFF